MINLSRNLFSFFWDITCWNRLGIRIATGENQTKVQDFVCTLTKFDTLGAHTMQCMYRSIEPVKLCHCRYWDADWFQLIVMHGMALCTPRLPICFKSANKIAVLLFGFPPVSVKFSVSTSQMKENKFLLKFTIYYFLVAVIPWELWWNEFTVLVTYFFCTLYRAEIVCVSL